MTQEWEERCKECGITLIVNDTTDYPNLCSICEEKLTGQPAQPSARYYPIWIVPRTSKPKSQWVDGDGIK